MEALRKENVELKKMLKNVNDTLAELKEEQQQQRPSQSSTPRTQATQAKNLAQWPK